ncbi:hypothetical protein ACLOJK_032615 [Asimina triloba]
MAMLEKQYHEELKMELQGISYSETLSNKNLKSSVEDPDAKVDSRPDLEQVVEDAEKMSKVLMSRKKKGIYEAIQIGKERKRARVNLLKERKRKAEASKQDFRDNGLPFWLASSFSKLPGVQEIDSTLLVLAMTMFNGCP